jgi:hypothetical protein
VHDGLKAGLDHRVLVLAGTFGRPDDSLMAVQSNSSVSRFAVAPATLNSKQWPFDFTNKESVDARSRAWNSQQDMGQCRG